MKNGTEKQPVNRVQWVDRATLKPNHYNPNHVAPPELELLITSIIEDGWTQPIVILEDGTIVDGFHRYTVSGDKRLLAMTGGMVPVVVVDLDPTHRMMSTIRHNRARGEHGVLPMANIVRTMYEEGVPQDEIQKRLGMEDEEVERLLDRSGMTIRGSADGFGRAWVPAAK
jgi:ParB-like chromosome segregation protein Spo0J